MARLAQNFAGFAGCNTNGGAYRFAAFAVFSTLLATFVAVPASAQRRQHTQPQHKDDAKHQVEKLEQSWRTAQLNNDVDAMDKLLSDDYVGITMNGQVVTKMQQLDRIRSRALKLTKIDLDDMKVKLTGPTAIVTGKAEVEGTNDGEPMHGTYRYTRVYMRSPGGAWKITNVEVTRVGEPRANRRGRGEQTAAPPGSPPAAGPQRLATQ
ncbi:MAG TPA: nuclear transport factor 2 family protein [Acidobacteriaceae bacterium]|nr:nuclear transport factor 2 family protein [Acidobacteriaceae bacterium]